jgi:hypothetical protein
MQKYGMSTFEGATPLLSARPAGNDSTPRAGGAADHAGWDDRQDDRAGRALTMWDRMAERERQLDDYRQAVERHLGAALAQTRDGDLERFFEHVERCFDWGVSGPACSRTWVLKVANETSGCT